MRHVIFRFPGINTFLGINVYTNLIGRDGRVTSVRAATSSEAVRAVRAAWPQANTISAQGLQTITSPPASTERYLR